MSIVYRISPPLSNADLNALRTTAWSQHKESDFQPVLAHSLFYLCAYSLNGQRNVSLSKSENLNELTLVGFINVAWDGGGHAFLLDTTVHAAWQRRGIGRELVLRAASEAKRRGIAWLHVDYEPHLDDFYRVCGFRPTIAGVMKLA